MTSENNSGMISPMDVTVTREEGLESGRYVARAPGVGRRPRHVPLDGQVDLERGGARP